MTNVFTVSLVRSGRHTLTFEAKMVKLPGYNGSMGIMAGRQPLLTVMEPGIITILDFIGHRHLFATTGGFCEMQNNEATLLCGSLICPEDLDNEPVNSGEPNYYRDPEKMSEGEKRTYAVALLRHTLLLANHK